MKKIIITLLLISAFAIGAQNPTHYFEGKWYKCYENDIELVVEKLPKCSTTNGVCADYDSKGNKIHVRDSDGYEWWYDYDSKGNEIHYKDTDGVELWYKWFFDEKNNTKYQCEVDENGNPSF